MKGRAVLPIEEDHPKRVSGRFGRRKPRDSDMAEGVTLTAVMLVVIVIVIVIVVLVDVSSRG